VPVYALFVLTRRQQGLSVQLPQSLRLL